MRHRRRPAKLDDSDDNLKRIPPQRLNEAIRGWRSTVTAAEVETAPVFRRFASPNDSAPTSLQQVVLGVDFGARATHVAMGSMDGDIVGWHSRPVDARRVILADAGWISDAATRLSQESGSPAAIGISFCGAVSDAHGSVAFSRPRGTPIHVQVRDRFEQRFGVPTVVETDARAGAMAEAAAGIARGQQDFVFLSLASGIRAAICMDGRLIRGAFDRAGDIGHWRLTKRGPRASGKAASWEALAPGSGLPDLARFMYPRRTWPEDLTADDLIASAISRDPWAGRVVRSSAVWLGWGIAYLVDLLDPQMVVLGRLDPGLQELVLPTAIRIARREIARENRTYRIVTSSLGDKIGPSSALAVAINASRAEASAPTALDARRLQQVHVPANETRAHVARR